MIMMMFDDFPMVDQSLGMPQLMLYKLLISCLKKGVALVQFWKHKLIWLGIHLTFNTRLV